MNSLEDPRIAAALDNLHRRAAYDWIVFARALPGVIGGMLVSTLVATFFVPLFFTLLERMSERSAAKDKASAGDAGEGH